MCTLGVVLVTLAVVLPPQPINSASLAPGACVTLDFPAPQEYGTGLEARLATAADMNQDAKQDLVTVGPNGVSILLGDGLGGFAAFPKRAGSARDSKSLPAREEV